MTRWHQRMMALTICLLLAAEACTTEPNGGGMPTPASGLGLKTIATSFDFPVFLTAPPGDLDRLFIVEKDGVIKIVKNGTTLSTPFLDITGITTKGSEQGLLGLAFPPDYATSGRFYVSYTTTGSAPGGTSVVAHYDVSSDPDVADGGSGVPILEFDQPYDNHNGGMIAFGPDGYLYAGFGDGGSGGDPQGHGQDRSELLGSILRLDVSGATYTVPADNPFVGTAGVREELWNYGLRNPWRFSFDRGTGDLYIGDVGQGAREEVDVQPAASTGGENYGWNTMEGRSCYPPGTSCNKSGLTLPVLDYGHGPGCSITGGYVYRGTAIPKIQGVYFYSDYCAGFLHSFRWQGGQVIESKSWPGAEPSGSVTSFGEDGSGELYLLTSGGGVYQLVDQP